MEQVRYKGSREERDLHRPAQNSVLQTYETRRTKTNGEYFSIILPTSNLCVMTLLPPSPSPEIFTKLNIPAVILPFPSDLNVAGKMGIYEGYVAERCAREFFSPEPISRTGNYYPR